MQSVVGLIREDDGAALGVQCVYRVAKNRVQQLLLILEVSQVMSRAEKGHELIARAKRAASVQQQAMDGFFPTVRRAYLHHQMLSFRHRLGGSLHNGRNGRRLTYIRAGFEQVDDKTHVAAADDVGTGDRPSRAGDALAVEKGAVGAFEVGQPPAPVGGKQASMLAADRSVVETDLERFMPPDPQLLTRLPGHLVAGVGSAQSNTLFHPIS